MRSARKAQDDHRHATSRVPLAQFGTGRGARVPRNAATVYLVRTAFPWITLPLSLSKARMTSHLASCGRRASDSPLIVLFVSAAHLGAINADTSDCPSRKLGRAGILIVAAAFLPPSRSSLWHLRTRTRGATPSDESHATGSRGLRGERLLIPRPPRQLRTSRPSRPIADHGTLDGLIAPVVREKYVRHCATRWNSRLRGHFPPRATIPRHAHIYCSSSLSLAGSPDATGGACS